VTPEKHCAFIQFKTRDAAEEANEYLTTGVAKEKNLKVCFASRNAGVVAA
jgi:hypothetical protein